MMKKKKKKSIYIKPGFKFGRQRIGVLVFNQSFSNMFITFRDLARRTIAVKTSGSAHVGFSKREKKSPNSVQYIVKNLLSYFKLYKITKFHIAVKTRVSVHIYMLINQLVKQGFSILSVQSFRRVPHNGCRKRKLRRK